MPSLVEDRMTVARAAIASTIAARTGMRFAGAPQSGKGEEDDIFLTLCSTPPAGYHLETELIPFEMIMRNVAALQTGEEVERREMTTADHFLEEINAFVHNRLLNPALPLAPLTPGVIDTETIDDIYRESLEHATFAGGVEADSKAYTEAAQMLFTDGDASEALETYRSYETRVQDARAALMAVAAEDAAGRDLAEQRLQRLEAEWIGIGRKREIEEAFRTLQEESAEAGFKDERSALLETFRAGEKMRFDLPGMSYHKVQIVPISPLLEDTNSFWQHIELDASAIRATLTNGARTALGLSIKRIHHATNRLRTLAFDFVVCDLLRDWIDPGFFSARFWRLDNTAQPLSDGTGGGRLPALPTRAVFIRGARIEYEGERSASPGTLAENASGIEPTLTSTLQIAPEGNVGSDRTNHILEAAERHGLTSSINLLKKENQHIRTTATRKAEAGTPALTVESEDSKDRLQPAVGSDNTSRSAMHAVAQPGKFERVPTRRGKVRDHRTSPTRPRDASGSAKVRDHRSPMKSIILSIEGGIETTEDQKDELRGLSLHYLRIWDDDERNIRLVQSTPTRLTFRRRLDARIREGDSISYHLILRDREENELDRRLVEADDDEDITLNWVVRVEHMVIEITGQFTPTLHGYGLTPLPPCPNPDEGLDWS